MAGDYNPENSAENPYYPFLGPNEPFSLNDLRAMNWWRTWARITRNQAMYQAMLAGNNDQAKNVYDDYTALMRNDFTIDAPFEPLDTSCPHWNNTERL